MTYWHNDIAHQRIQAAEAASELGAEQEQGDGLDPARGIIYSIALIAACAVAALVLSSVFGGGQ